MTKVAIKDVTVTKRPLNVNEVQLVSGGRRNKNTNSSKNLAVGLSAKGRWGLN